MKKFVFGLIATVMLSFSANAQGKKLPGIVGQTQLTPKTVGLYSAGSSSCWGWSFCNATAPWDLPTQTGTTYQTLNANKTMTFKIPLSSLNAQNVQFYAGKTTFELKDDSPLQVGEYKLFGLPQGSKYLAGVYDLVNTGAEISFTVKFL